MSVNFSSAFSVVRDGGPFEAKVDHWDQVSIFIGNRPGAAEFDVDYVSMKEWHRVITDALEEMKLLGGNEFDEAQPLADGDREEPGSPTA